MGGLSPFLPFLRRKCAATARMVTASCEETGTDDHLAVSPGRRLMDMPTYGGPNKLPTFLARAGSLIAPAALSFRGAPIKPLEKSACRAMNG